jgi:hypothetical protein
MIVDVCFNNFGRPLQAIHSIHSIHSTATTVTIDTVLVNVDAVIGWMAVVDA